MTTKKHVNLNLLAKLMTLLRRIRFNLAIAAIDEDADLCTNCICRWLTGAALRCWLGFLFFF